jgi:hypothetical protein
VKAAEVVQVEEPVPVVAEPALVAQAVAAWASVVARVSTTAW